MKMASVLDGNLQAVGQQRQRRRWWIAFIVTWLVLLGAAFAFDRQVAQWVHDAVPFNKQHLATKRLLTVLKLPGYFPFTAAVALLLGIYHRRHWQGALALVTSAALVGLLYSVIKWIAGRHRPGKEPGQAIAPFAFHPFSHGFAGIWREPALCFPSGHSSLAFATAMCLALLLPRWRWAFFVIAAITAAERVLENAHYLSDVVAGAGLGIGTAWLVARVILGPERDRSSTRLEP